jgi:hypothetical protein
VGSTKAADILEMVKSFFFAKQNFDWKEKLHTVSNDGAPATLGNISGFATVTCISDYRRGLDW